MTPINRLTHFLQHEPAAEDTEWFDDVTRSYWAGVEDGARSAERRLGPLHRAQLNEHGDRNFAAGMLCCGVMVALVLLVLGRIG